MNRQPEPEAAETKTKKRQYGSGIYGQKCLKNLDFTEKINRLQDVTIEISYVNMCGVLCGECRIFAAFLENFA